MAAAIAYLFGRPVAWLEKHYIPRPLGIIALYLLAGGIVATFVLIISPILFSEISRLAAALPEYTFAARQYLLTVQSRYHSFLPAELAAAADSVVSGISADVEKALGKVMAGIPGLLFGMWEAVVAPVLAFYILRDWESIRSTLVSLIPRRIRPEVLGLAAEIDRAVGGWIRGQAVLALIIGSLTGLALSAIGVRYAALLGIVAGSAEFVPYFGPILAAVPGIGIAFLQSRQLAVWTAVAYVVIQQAEGAVIAPHVIGSSMGLHPLTVVFALLAGARVGGVLGMLLAVPLAGVVKVTVQYLYTKFVQVDIRDLRPKAETTPPDDETADAGCDDVRL